MIKFRLDTIEEVAHAIICQTVISYYEIILICELSISYEATYYYLYKTTKSLINKCDSMMGINNIIFLVVER